MVIKNLKAAAKRIKEAIRKQEKIIIYSDADLDGVASLIILKEAIKNLGGEISAIYFPDREIEGYGLTETGLDALKKFAPALLLTLDLGIGNFKEVKKAKKLGLEVIIVDHHEVLDKLPEAKIIVDPKQKGDKSSFKKFAAVGVVFKLTEVLLGKKMTGIIKNNFLELVALATIADMMPREDDNKIFIDKGLRNIENSWRPGIKVFFKERYFDNSLNLDQKISQIISILNVRDVKNNLPASFRLLTFSSLEESKKLVEELLKKKDLRREKIDKITGEIEERISRRPEEPIIFEGDSEWDFTSLSAVASIICHSYRKPVFIFKKIKGCAQGTVRSPSDVNSVNLMKACKKHLLSYGGHPQAAGFKIKNEYLEKFKKCLIKKLR